MEKTHQHAAKAHALLLHLITCPTLAEELKRLHDLALYESGDAMLGKEDKQALMNCRELAERLELLGEADKAFLRDIL